jgi:hypothetical protein
MDRSQLAVCMKTAGKLAWAAGRLGILGQRLPPPNPRQCRCGSRGSVCPCYDRHHVGGESISARPAIKGILSYHDDKGERGRG